MKQRTLTIVKPDAVERNLIGSVLNEMERAGLKIIASKLIRLNLEQAEGFYHVHKERPFFNALCAYMTSGPCLPTVLEGEDAILKLRKIMGATDPAEAEEGTIRKKFAESKERNSVHGSDAPETAEFEIKYFFPDLA